MKPSITMTHLHETQVLAPELSFGMELQFLALPPEDVDVLIDHWPQVSGLIERDVTYKILAGAIASAGLPAAFLFETTKDECRDHPLRELAPRGCIVKTGVSKDMFIINPPTPPREPLSRRLLSLSSARASRVAAEGINPLFRYWLLKTAADAYGTGPTAAWQPMALNSPILGEPEAAGGFCAMQRALAALRREWRGDMRADTGCALHVHVSPAMWELTPRHAMRVATLVLLLEDPLLFHLCGSQRSRAHASLRKGAAMAGPPVWRDDEGPRVRFAPEDLPACVLSDASVLNLWTSRELGEVAEMLDRPANRSLCRTTALGIKAQKHPNGRETHTLEFRHAAASLDVVLVGQWLALITTICKVAWLDVDGYKASLERMWAVVQPGPAPEDAWRPLLRIVNGAAPSDWNKICNETFWEYHLADQNRERVP